MRLLLATFALVLGSGLAAAPIPKELKQRPDRQRIQGVWLIPPQLRWYFQGDKLFSGGTDTSSNLGTEYGIVLRPESTPSQMDITQNGQLLCTGIYKFEGEELHIAYVHNGERPTDYAPGGAKSVYVLKRAPESK